MRAGRRKCDARERGCLYRELVVYANSITRTETDAKGEETEREIPYMKG